MFLTELCPKSLLPCVRVAPLKSHPLQGNVIFCLAPSSAIVLESHFLEEQTDPQIIQDDTAKLKKNINMYVRALTPSQINIIKQNMVCYNCIY